MAAVLRGIVRTPEGTPLAGASVGLASSPSPMPDIAQLTGPDGRFALAAPVSGTYVLDVTAPDGRSRRVEATVGQGDPDPLEVVLDRG